MKRTRILFISESDLELCNKALLYAKQFQQLHDYTVECTALTLSSGDPIPSVEFDIVITLNSNLKESMPLLFGSPTIIHRPNSNHTPEDDLDLAEFIKSFFSNGFFTAIINQKRNTESMLSSINEGIIAHNLERKIFYYSPRAEEILGINKELVLGRDCHEVFPQMLCGPNCSFCEAGNDYKNFSTKHYTTTLTFSGDSKRELEVSVVPLINERGNTYGVISTINDISYLEELKRELDDEQSFHGIVGLNSKMQNIFELIRNVAVSDFPVAINGESGTGKELVATAIHKESSRKDQHFVPINCGALPEGTLESELFGHVRGAFTGATRDKKGRFELAHGGTLFLDEIGEMPLNVQVKLLRVLQEGTIEPVGSEKARRVDVRILSATNRDLKEMVQEGTFREDLYYRLSVVPIELPPLRKRQSDIAILANDFLSKTAKKMGRDSAYFSKETVELLMNYNWPGNVRQLQNAIQYCLIKSSGHKILPIHLPPEIFSVQENIKPIEKKVELPQPIVKQGRHKLTTEKLIEALRQTAGNKAKAARLLSVGRATLYNYINSNPAIKEKLREFDF